jgi:hypothetical protein
MNQWFDVKLKKGSGVCWHLSKKKNVHPVNVCFPYGKGKGFATSVAAELHCGY